LSGYCGPGSIDNNFKPLNLKTGGKMSFNPIQSLQRAAAIASVLLLGACATPTKMAYGPDVPAPDLAKKQVLLLTATLKNDHKPNWQPNAHFIAFEKEEVKGAADRLNFVLDDPAKKETPNGNDYLLRMELENGKYMVRGIWGLSRSFPIMGNFFMPLHIKIDSRENGVFYGGHISGTIRERVGDEFRAGAVIPLIDQAVTGFATGTFDVKVSDRYNDDVAAFKKAFPALANTEIKKAIIPDFDRKAAQEWWEKN
jgi:hypothetical protein